MFPQNENGILLEKIEGNHERKVKLYTDSQKHESTLLHTYLNKM